MVTCWTRRRLKPLFMRRVLVLDSCAGVDYSVNAGEITELPDEIANDLINHKLAEAYEDSSRTNKDDAVKPSGSKRLVKTA